MKLDLDRAIDKMVARVKKNDSKRKKKNKSSNPGIYEIIGGDTRECIFNLTRLVDESNLDSNKKKTLYLFLNSILKIKNKKIKKYL